MKVTLKLFSGLIEYLPDDVDDNAATVTVDAQTSAHQLLEMFKVPRVEAEVLMLNGAFLPPDSRDAPLDDGDVVSAWPVIQGG